MYALSGTSQFVDVSYEMAVGNISIHVLTTLAVVGTVVLGCALEGALLLVLFQTAHFVETRLTGTQGEIARSLWATVPGEANVVDLNPTGRRTSRRDSCRPGKWRSERTRLSRRGNR